MPLISTPSDLNPESLAGILRRNGYGEFGGIIALEPNLVAEDPVSRSFSLRIFYETDLRGRAPTHLLLKITEAHLPFVSHEILFYSQVSPLMQDSAVTDYLPQCLDSFYDSGRQQGHLLLTDYTFTHRPPGESRSQAAAITRQMVEIISAIHGFWWDHPRLGDGIGELRSLQEIETMIASARGRARQFLKAMGDRFTPKERSVIEQATSGLTPWRLDRYLRREGVTITHRDPLPQRFFFPKRGIPGPPILTGWHSWRVDPGTDDLAHLMAARWTREKRSEEEMKAINRYHTGLESHGVKDYPFDHCLRDYRSSVAWLIFVLAGGWRRRRSPALYMDRLKNCLAAFEDLACDDLF